jgi:hypothetical protein
LPDEIESLDIRALSRQRRVNRRHVDALLGTIGQGTFPRVRTDCRQFCSAYVVANCDFN